MPGPRRTDEGQGRSEGGASLPELLVVLAIVGLMGGGAWRALAELRDERAGREAARGVVADLRRTALDARRLGRTLAVEFDQAAPARWRVLMDGNGNGVTSADIAAGIDPPYAPWTLVVREGQARLAVPRDVPEADGSGTVPAGSNPVRLGVTARVTFTPRGTATSGSIHLAGRGDRAYAIRLLGSTQRVRLSCLSSAGAWEIC